MQGKQMGFPQHLIDPKAKGRQWCLDYCKSIWSENSAFSTRYSSFYHKRDEYYEIARYMEGRQNVTQYKSFFPSDAKTNESYLNLDYSNIGLQTKFVQIAMAIMDKRNFNIRADAIDPIANHDNQKWYASKKAELMLRKEIEKADPQLVERLGLSKASGDPTDDEELELQYSYTYQHQLSVEMQQIINGVMRQNKVFREGRHTVRKNLLYYGVAGWKDDIGPDGSIILRPVDISTIITSFCKERDFSDAIYIGEVRSMSMYDLKHLAGEQFSDDEYIQAYNMSQNPKRDPSMMYRLFGDIQDKKVEVLDIEWSSVDQFNYQVGETRFGNMTASRADFYKKGGDYYKRSVDVKYRAKWLVNSDLIFDFGRVPNTKVKNGKAQFSYHLHAPVFTEMEISSIGEFVKPIADQIMLDWLRFQQFKAEVRVDGYDIEMGALENISLGKGGESMKPMEILDLLSQKGILLWRRQDAIGDDRHYKPVNQAVFPGVEKAMGWYQSIQANMQMLRDVLGLNEITDGSTPDPRTLVPVAQAAMQGTNNSIFFLMDSEEKLMESLAGSIITRVKDLADVGHLGKYEKMVGKNTVEFFSASKGVSAHDFGIRLMPTPSDEQRTELINDARSLAGGDMISMEDFVLIRKVEDLDVASQLLAFRLRRRQKQKHEEALQLQKANAEVQIESNQNAEVGKRETLVTENDLKKDYLTFEVEQKIRLMQEEARLLGTVTNNKS